MNELRELLHRLDRQIEFEDHQENSIYAYLEFQAITFKMQERLAAIENQITLMRSLDLALAIKREQERPLP